MAKTEITKPTDTAVSRPRDIFSAMRSEMDRMFERFEHGFPRLPLFRGDHATVMVPDLEVRENASAITVEAELPGVEEKDISVTLSNGILSIKGEKKQEREDKEEHYYRMERSYGAFVRTVRLPSTVDGSKVTASFKNGLLKVTLPKSATAKGTTIPIKAE